MLGGRVPVRGALVSLPSMPCHKPILEVVHGMTLKKNNSGRILVIPFRPAQLQLKFYAKQFQNSATFESTDFCIMHSAIKCVKQLKLFFTT